MPAGTTTLSKVYTKEELCLMEQVPEACGIVIFGASGDLTFRKLLPALFELATANVLPKACYILGVGRTPLSDDDFRKKIRDDLKASNGTNLLDDFVKRCSYLPGDYSD